MKLYRTKSGNYVVYDKHGKVVIITHNKNYAIAYARSLNDGDTTR